MSMLRSSIDCSYSILFVCIYEGSDVKKFIDIWHFKQTPVGNWQSNGERSTLFEQ